MTYEQIADGAGLFANRKRLYCDYMKARWSQDEEVKCQSGYAREWAERFFYGNEYAHSDAAGKALLDNLYKGIRAQ